MSTGKMKFILYVMFSVCMTGCAAVSPLQNQFENNFIDFKAAKEDIASEAALKRTYPDSYDEVWLSSLKILSQYALIVNLSKDSGTISYVDINGVYFSDVFGKDEFLYFEFPFTVSIEKQPEGTVVKVYPMIDLYGEYAGKKWYKVVENAFNQRSEEFLEYLSVQLEAKGRWPWLTKEAK